MPPLATGEMGAISAVRLLRQVYPVAASKTIAMSERDVVLGRDPGQGGLKLDDGETSRRHAMISFDRRTQAHVLKDLDSSNGSFVDGSRVNEMRLGNGSVVRVGRSIFVYVSGALSPGSPFPLLKPGMSLARALVEGVADRAARASLPILIYGPTGAGKERMAERIHEKSNRSGRLVSLNCGALSSELLGSELFGHVKGAYSGAQGERGGLFASADGGTLFLDEIAELPSDQQPALLRACETGCIRPVGADRDMEVNVRLVAATHTDLDAACEAGTFRTDLLARLRGITLRIPPLRERRDEILSLFDEFVDGVPFGITVAERLLMYTWPENVRELKNLSQYVSLFAEQLGSIHPSHLPERISPPSRSMETTGGPPDPQELERLLTVYKGNVSQVAQALGVHRQQAYRWLSKAELDPSSYR